MSSCSSPLSSTTVPYYPSYSRHEYGLFLIYHDSPLSYYPFMITHYDCQYVPYSTIGHNGGDIQYIHICSLMSSLSTTAIIIMDYHCDYLLVNEHNYGKWKMAEHSGFFFPLNMVIKSGSSLCSSHSLNISEGDLPSRRRSSLRRSGRRWCRWTQASRQWSPTRGQQG